MLEYNEYKIAYKKTKDDCKLEDRILKNSENSQSKKCKIADKKTAYITRAACNFKTLLPISKIPFSYDFFIYFCSVTSIFNFDKFFGIEKVTYFFCLNGPKMLEFIT